MAEESPTPFRFFVPMLREHSGYLNWIQSNGAGLEIQDLLHPRWPSDDSAPLGIGDFWKKALSRQHLAVNFHGPDIGPLLADGRESEALDRTRVAMVIAAEIGARFFVVHPGLGAAGRIGRTQATTELWRQAAEDAGKRDLILLLENTDEGDPAALLRIAREINSPSVGFCLDVGHARCHSRLGIIDWIDAMGRDLHYVHLYNSTGDGAHRALGDGDLDLGAFLGRLASRRPGIALCVEMDVPQILTSVSWLTAKGLFRLKAIEAQDLF